MLRVIFCVYLGRKSYFEVALPAFEVVERYFGGLLWYLPGDQVLLSLAPGVVEKPNGHGVLGFL